MVINIMPDHYAAELNDNEETFGITFIICKVRRTLEYLGNLCYDAA